MSRRIVLSFSAAAVVAAAFALAPGAASAADVGCGIGEGTNASLAFQARFSPIWTSADAAAREALGQSQYGMLWQDNVRQGWAVGLAPGPLDPTTARQAIADRLATRFTGDDLAFLLSTLRVEPMPFSEFDLRTTQDAVIAELAAANLGPTWGAGVTCVHSDAFRVEVELYNTRTDATLDAVQRAIAPYGDRVKLVLSPYGPPTPAVGEGTGTAAPSPPASGRGPGAPAVTRAARLADAIVTPSARRCVSGTAVGVRLRTGATGVSLVTVHAGGRTQRISGARLAKQPLRIALRSRSTAVAVDVRWADGSRAATTLTYRRCGR